ncbi:MAG: DNA-binding protein WhiA [Actinobacteria bacterium]|nr:DNA-binding protein WhiA [Actinomycetota bacterium]
MTGDGPAPPHGSGFTERVKQELARLEPGDRVTQRAELAAILRLGGALHLHPGAPPEERLTVEVVTTSGAVARRAFALLQRVYELRPEVQVRAPGGVRRRTTYVVVVAVRAEDLARDIGMLDPEGRPSGEIPRALVADRGHAVAYLRGAFLAAGSVSAPSRPPHLEVPTGSPSLADRLAVLVRRTVDRPASTVGDERPRLVVKSGETIGELLASWGATGAFLAWDEQRLRRSLRSEANRLANADAANLRRTIEAASDQTAAVAEVIEQVGWDGLAPELREVALVRLANPAASLAELGELCDPPVGKSSVHRRLRRILALVEDG